MNFHLWSNGFFVTHDISTILSHVLLRHCIIILDNLCICHM
jgi:hypothetical protein